MYNVSPKEGIAMIVDAHLHVFVKPSKQYPRSSGGLAPKEREAPIEQLMDLMAANGVSKAGLVQLSGTSVDNHNYLRDCLHKFPNQFAGIGLVDEYSNNPGQELDELVQATGVKGIRLGQLGDPNTTDATQLLAYPLWQRCAEHGLIMWLYPALDQAPLIETLAAAFPSVPVVLNHLGICPDNFSIDAFRRPHVDISIPPATMPTILKLAKYPNVFVKISGEYAFSREAYPYRDLQPVVNSLYQAFGAGRLLWATDFPWIVEEPGYNKLLHLVDEHLPSISRDERIQIMGGTASSLLGFDLTHSQEKT